MAIIISEFCGLNRQIFLYMVSRSWGAQRARSCKWPHSWDWLGAKMGLLAGVSISLHMDPSMSLLEVPHSSCSKKMHSNCKYANRTIPNMPTFIKLLLTSHLLISHLPMPVTGPNPGSTKGTTEGHEYQEVSFSGASVIACHHSSPSFTNTSAFSSEMFPKYIYIIRFHRLSSIFSSLSLSFWGVSTQPGFLTKGRGKKSNTHSMNKHVRSSTEEYTAVRSECDT